MGDFRDQWSIEMALEILQQKTVDSKTWTDAAKWLLLYGPPEIQDLIRQASATATNKYFPDLGAARFNEDGQPCYEVEAVASALGVSKEELLEHMAEMEREFGVKHLFEESDTHKIQ